MNRTFVRGAVFGATLCVAGLLGIQACHRVAPRAGAEGPVADDEVSREAIQGYVDRGEAAIPELGAMLASEDPTLRRRAKVALARITGQWGNDGRGISWKRSLDEATDRGKPILVLQLFGQFDREFC